MLRSSPSQALNLDTEARVFRLSPANRRFSMHLIHMARRSFLHGVVYTLCLRRVSTFVGKSGRVYTQREELQRHRLDPGFSVFRAECASMHLLSKGFTGYLANVPKSNDESVVFTRVSKTFDLSHRPAADIADSRRLRMYVVCHQEEGILFYPHFKSTLLALIENDPELSMTACNKVVRNVGEAIWELHHKDWIHIGMKLNI